jgi:hypothetical protein
MPVFKVNVPITTPASQPTIQVDQLGAGVHRFQLVVEDDRGNQSAPAFVSVTVRAGAVTGPAGNPGSPSPT